MKRTLLSVLVYVTMLVMSIEVATGPGCNGGAGGGMDAGDAATDAASQ